VHFNNNNKKNNSKYNNSKYNNTASTHVHVKQHCIYYKYLLEGSQGRGTESETSLLPESNCALVHLPIS